MRTKLVVLAAALGALLLGGGCSSLIYLATSKTGSETPPEVRSGLTSNDVTSKLGKPVAVRPLPDGGQVATYEYRLPDRGAVQKAKETAGIHLFLWGAGLGALSVLAEPVLMGMAIHNAVINAATPSRGSVILTYGPDGRLLVYGSPPSYGPPEDALEPPSVGALRKSCWSGDRIGSAAPETGGEEAATEDREYVECVARRFAIWGID